MQDIVVGVDGTPAGDAALRWALAEGSARSTRVTAVHAWQVPAIAGPVGADPMGADLAELGARAHQVLEEAVSRAAASLGSEPPPGVPPALPARVTPVVAPGPAAQVLETRARSASLLVLGRRHETALSRAMFGSVISAALHHVACPIVVVPTGYEPGTLAEPGIGRVVVGVADGQASDGALQWAAATAAGRRWPLVPVLVRPPATGSLEGGNWPAAADLDASGLAHLARQASIAAPALPVVAEPEVLVGEPGEELVRYASPHDILVVGSRGRGHLAGWFLGSTSGHVARNAHCPVVVVRDGP